MQKKIETLDEWLKRGNQIKKVEPFKSAQPSFEELEKKRKEPPNYRAQVRPKARDHN